MPTSWQDSPSLVKKCSTKQCKTCPSLVTGPTFKSSVTGRTYQVRSLCGPLGCQSRNVVYLITCKQCDVQYVGETSQMLRSRMNNHRTSTKGFKPVYFYNHFNSDNHSFDDALIMPIEQIHETPKSTSLRLLREAFWYKELCSIYPYRLNDNIKGVGNISKLKKEIIVWNLFNRLSHKRRHRHSNLKSTGSSNNATFNPEWLKERLPLYKNVGFLANLNTILLHYKLDTFIAC